MTKTNPDLSEAMLVLATSVHGRAGEPKPEPETCDACGADRPLPGEVVCEGCARAMGWLNASEEHPDDPCPDTLRVPVLEWITERDSEIDAVGSQPAPSLLDPQPGETTWSGWPVDGDEVESDRYVRSEDVDFINKERAEHDDDREGESWFV